MEFRVLGPAEVVAEGRSLDIGGERPHALLALLLLNRNRVVAADSLVDLLWGERPPATAAKTLQVYVSRLRKVLGSQRLVTRSPGYLLVVDDDELDLARFESLVAEARTGDARFASARLREALALFKAEPLANVRHHDFAETEARRIEELRLAALEDRIDADLALGEHGRLIGELESLAAENPFRERLRAQLMLALYRSGRQKQALELYQRTRRELVDELGIEPGPSLQALHRAVLNQDVSLGDRAAGVEAAGAQRAERKVVTAVFIDLVGFTALAERLDPEDVQALLAPYYARVRSELERFGGTVEKFIGDAVMALFGVPNAREDDAERAVRAAFAVRDSVAELMRAHGQEGLELRIGINTGEALVTFGGEAGEPRAVGDVVNTAARLESAASADVILVGERTRRVTQHAIEYRRVDDIEAKGKSAPVPAWEALAPLASIADVLGRQEVLELVGRSAELTLLEESLSRARRLREPHLVTLVGGPGIGKSRLVHELGRVTLGVEEPARWLQGRCLPYGDGVTFAAMSEVVKACAGVLETDTATAATEKLRAILGRLPIESGERDRLEIHLRLLLGLEADDAGEGRSSAFAAWRRFLEAVAELEPLVLVFEDLHWADADFLDFVDDLVEWADDAPMLVVCTARPEFLERRPAWAGGQRNAATVTLAPLDDAETAQLLQGLLGSSRLSTNLERAVLERSGGIPLYAEEYIRMLGDRGYLTGEVARGLAAGDELPEPENVQAILAARLDLLTPDEKDLLGDAAIVGTVFWEGALATTTASPRSLVESRLSRLEKKDLVRRRRRTSVAGETEWTFRHVLVRDAAYAQLPRARRYHRHRLVAQWIESIAADRDDKIELLAHHYLQALEYATAAGERTPQIADRARLFLREAGDRASTLSAPAAAVRFLTSALELWPPDDAERPRLLLELGRARVLADMEGSDELQAARKGALEASDPEVAAEAEAWLGHLAAAHGDHAASLAHLESAYARVERRPASTAKALVADKLAGRHMAAASVEAAFRYGRSALRIYEKLGDERGRVEILNTIGSTRAAVGDRAGLADLEESIAIARAHDLPQGLARACLNLAYFVTVYDGRGDRVDGLHAEGRAAVLRAGDARLLGYYQAIEAVDAFSDGRWDEARALCDGFLDETQQAPHHQEHLFRLVRADVAKSRGEAQLALSDARRAIEFARAVREPQSLYLALGWGAWILDSIGGEGRMYAEELLDRWVQQGRAFAPSVWILAAAFVLGPSDALESTLSATPASTVWLEAALCVASGDLARTAQLCARAGSRPSEAYARLCAAEAFHAEGQVEEAVRQLDLARAFYADVGASAFVEQANALARSPTLVRT